MPQVLVRSKGRDVLGGRCSPPQPLPAGLLSLLQVVTAENLMDPSDPSESDEHPPAQEVSKAPSSAQEVSRALMALWEGRATCLLLPGQGFRLEDVDWNTVAHRYPNLFTNIKPKSGYR